MAPAYSQPCPFEDRLESRLKVSIAYIILLQTLYKNRRAIPGAKSFDEPLPPNSKPYYLYFIARHGTRWPTKKRMRQYSTLESLFEVKSIFQNSYLFPLKPELPAELPCRRMMTLRCDRTQEHLSITKSSMSRMSSSEFQSMSECGKLLCAKVRSHKELVYAQGGKVLLLFGSSLHSFNMKAGIRLKSLLPDRRQILTCSLG